MPIKATSLYSICYVYFWVESIKMLIIAIKYIMCVHGVCMQLQAGWKKAQASSRKYQSGGGGGYSPPRPSPLPPNGSATAFDGFWDESCFISHTTIVIIVKFSTSNYLTPLTEIWKINSNFRQSSSHVYAVNGSRMCVQLKCWTFASKYWVKLEHNCLFCAEHFRRNQFSGGSKSGGITGCLLLY